MEILKYSLIQSHIKKYTKGSLDDIISNSQTKAYDYMFNKSKDGLDYVAISYCGNKIKYLEMLKKIELYAKAFKKYGIGHGDYVTLVLTNTPEIIYIKYALNRIGAIANLVDPRTNPERILTYTNDVKSRLLIASLEIIDSRIEPIKNRLRVDNILTISVSKSMRFNTKSSAKGNMIYLLLKYRELMFQLKNETVKNYKYINIDDFLAKYNNFTGLLDTKYEQNEPFTVYYTSGSSGTPKGVLEPNEAYNAMVEQMTFGNSGIDFEKGETFLGIIPFFVSYGSLSGMHNSLCRNWNIILLPKFDPNKFDLLLSKYKPNNALGVPRFWEAIVKEHRVDDVDFSFLKRPVTGGDRINLESVNEINQFFNSHGATNTKLKIGYGASEFGGCVSATSDNYREYTASSAGTILLACRGMIVDPVTNEEVLVGCPGEICINSPSQMIEYLNHPKETAEITIYDDMGNKYYKTGDKGYIDLEGNLYVIGRYKRAMMRPDGHTVHACPIEEVILRDKRVDNCCVVGLKEKGISGDIPTAFVKLKNPNDNFSRIIDEIDQNILINLPERDKPLAYVQLDDIQFTLMGKVNYLYYEKLSFDEVEAIIKDDYFFGNSKVLKKNK